MAAESRVTKLIVCHTCRQPLGKKVAFSDGLFWHLSCLHCINCKKSLRDGKFQMKNEVAFCTKCFKYMYIQRCVECCLPIKASSTCVKAMDVKWHHKCFQCFLCHVQLTTYSVLNKRPICLLCLHKEQSVTSTTVSTINDTSFLSRRSSTCDTSTSSATISTKRQKHFTDFE